MSLGKWVRRHRGWIAVVAVAAVGATAYAIARGTQPEAPKTTYTTESVERGTLSVTIDGTGYLAVRDEVAATADVTGEIESIDVVVGDKVEAGDILYTIDDSAARKQIASTKASRRQASQSLAQASLSLYRAKASLAKLEDQSGMPSSTVDAADIAIAEKEVSIAKSGVTSAQENYDSADADYDEAVAALEDYQVAAPCDGIVWSVNVEIGDTAGSTSGGTASSGGSTAQAGGTTATSSSSSAPVTIARDGLMGVQLSVNEVDVTTLEPGQDAEVLFDAVSDLTMTGTIDEVSRDGTVESGVVSYSVWLTLDGTDKRLKPGMSASATIVTQVQRDVLLVSNAAVKTATDGSSYVQVLAEGAAAPTDTAVQTGVASATQTVILSGIEEGAKIVTKTTTADSEGDNESESSDERPGAGGGIMMMGGTGGPPVGGPGGQ